MNVKPDIIGEVYFYSVDEGGLSNLIGGTNLNCPVKIDEDLYDARIFIKQGRYIQSGVKVELPIKFLSFKNVKDKIEVGTIFYLRSLNEFAKGTIVKINS